MNAMNGKAEMTAQEEKKWELGFEDHFAGNAVNEKEWWMYDTPGHAGNGLRRPAAFSVNDGILTVTAQMIGGNLVSGGMAHRKNYTYGKFEFRVRTEPDPSEATSGVILTWPESENWPSDGENDIYETCTEPTRERFHTFIHYHPSNKQHQFTHNIDATKWHVVAMEWGPEEIRIYIDGTLSATLNDPEAIPHVPHHLCIQLDAFKKEMEGIVHMYVDWVKIYQAVE